MNALLDKDFLKQLDSFNNRETYARITALSVDELPLELIEGKIISGSINVDGASALRRTCSVSLVAQDVNINDFYWGLNNKFKLEIGLKNFINEKYPDIIWFPQGIYNITSFNSNLALNNFTISINGKDKMCQLNGEIGGVLPAQIDFGVEDYYDFKTGVTIHNKIPIKKIIREMIHTYVGEPYHNIIINDLEDNGLELLEYRGDSPLYLLYHVNSESYIEMIFNDDMPCYIVGTETPITIGTIPKYNKRIDDLLYDEATKIQLVPNGEVYLVSKIEYGETAGYRLTELTYPGDLIAGIGETITSILDKIVNMLGNFEYFYDLNGRFVFQSKKTYLNVGWNSIIDTEDDIYVENAAYANKSTYYFNGNNLISSLSNTPNLNNIKNDYIIWGTRKSSSGADIPIHFRYAIHKKPIYYKNYNGEVFISRAIENLDEALKVDWREIIYQMAIDYYAHNAEEDYLNQIAKNNYHYYPTGITGYEPFYLDFQAFWRELYNPFEEKSYKNYNYEYNDEKTFIALDEQKKKIEELYVSEKYIKLTSADKDKVNKKDVIVLKGNELYNLLDTIPVYYNFDANGEQDKYYITSNASDTGFKAITAITYKSVNKSEIYVKIGEDYIPLIETADLNNNCYLKEKLPEGQVIKISNLQKEIQKLYFNGDTYNKYYTKSTLGLDGEIDPTKPKEFVYLNYMYSIEKYYTKLNELSKPELQYWNKNVQENPDLINFWIDFLDTGEDNSQQSELSKYSIFAIGNRPKVVNDTNVKSIYYRNIPNVIYAKKEDVTQDILKEKSGYVFMYLTEGVFNSDYFNISSQGKSARDMLNELLYKHSYCTETVNTQTIPIYYLEPNTLISIEDKNANINGEYILNKITIPLTYNGMMNIQATKAPQRLY